MEYSTIEKQKISYPTSIFYIISNELCERFSFNGIATVLPIYLTDQLFFSEENATHIFHLFTFLAFFFPLFGAMIADSWLGKFKTILYFSIIYVSGNLILALATALPIGSNEIFFSIIGLMLIAFGTGGIKPCVAAFGGDQFILPHQEKQLALFFSIFFFTLNLGAFLSSFITPILRNQSCFGNENCFILAFGIPGVLMMISIIIFYVGKSLYRIKPPEENMVLKVFKAIFNAISIRSKNKERNKVHWLDYAEEKYGRKFITEIKSTLNILILFVPLPIFWTLFGQQITTWTFLARRMDGNIGSYYILPEQLIVINSVLCLVFIPLYQYVVYPILDKLNLLKTPLKRLTAGGMLASFAFLISGYVASIVEAQTQEVGFGHTNFYNNLPCPITIFTKDVSNKPIEISEYKFKQFVLSSENTKDIPYTIHGNCFPHNYNGNFELNEEKAVGYYFFNETSLQKFVENEVNEPSLRFLLRAENFTNWNTNITVINEDEDQIFIINAFNVNKQNLSKSGRYKIIMQNLSITIDVEMKDAYVIMGGIDDQDIFYEKITGGNRIHMLLLVPQYLLMTLAEVMFAITGLEFAYSQAPKSMKSVLQSGWLLTIAVGNLLVVLIKSIGTLKKTSHNLYLFAIIMFIDMLIFSFMAMRYTYVDSQIEETSEVNNKDPEKVALKLQNDDRT